MVAQRLGGEGGHRCCLWWRVIVWFFFGTFIPGGVSIWRRTDGFGSSLFTAFSSNHVRSHSLLFTAQRGSFRGTPAGLCWVLARKVFPSCFVLGYLFWSGFEPTSRQSCFLVFFAGFFSPKSFERETSMGMICDVVGRR